MDFKEKLEKAAKHEAYENYDRSYLERRDGFIKGVEWLQSQPLSERLTKEEKKKINKLQEEIFKEIMDAHDADDWQSAAHYILDVMPRTFASIFDIDLFKEK